MKRLLVLCLAVLALSVWTIPAFAVDAAPATNTGTAMGETKEKKHEELEAKKKAREEKVEERKKTREEKVEERKKAREERREKRKKEREERRKHREERREKRGEGRKAEKGSVEQQTAPATTQTAAGQSGN